VNHDDAFGINDWDDHVPSKSRVGEVLGGKYEVVRKVGEGGMGEVYEARHHLLGRRFAIKLLRPEFVRSRKMQRRFSREALSASRLESDHVVAVIDCGHLSEGVPYYVMELLRGQDLRNLLRQSGRLDVAHAARLIVDVCRGLQIAHGSGLVHRDLKPENIFVAVGDDGRECAKILDFGVVQLCGGNSTADDGALVGTLKYMAPEQALGQALVDQRADLYALGAILYECITGVVPHPGRNKEEVLFHVMNQEPKPLAEFGLDLSSDVVLIIRRALERRPEMRFQFATELEAALLRLLDQSDTKRCSALPAVIAADGGQRSLAVGTITDASVAVKPRSSVAILAATKFMPKKRWVLSGVVLLVLAPLYLSKRSSLTEASNGVAILSTADRAARLPPFARLPIVESAPNRRPFPDPLEEGLGVDAGRAPETTPVRLRAAATAKQAVGIQPSGYDALFDGQNPYVAGKPGKR
jgi:serine/threonine protein kinase